MKKCPFCAEMIQSEAIKCRYCGERLDTNLTIGDSEEQLKRREKLRGQDYSQHHEEPKEESPTVSSPKQNTVIIAPIEKPKEEGESLYEAILGEKNRIYYLTKFKEFDQQTLSLREQKVGWNWAAFFGCWIWAIYRKMYGWFFCFLGIMIIYGFFEKEGFPILGFFILLVPWIVFTMFANSFYHGSVKKKIAAAQRSIRDRSQLLEFLRYKGGVHTWAIWVFGLLPVIGIAAAIIIPQIVSYNKRTEESTWSKPEAVVETPAPAAPAPASISDSGVMRALFYQELERIVPQWEAINSDPNFVEWLRGYDDGSKYSRQVLITEAYNRSDFIEVSKYFKSFLSEHGDPRTLPTIK